jgi:multidrug/hemolysin transport system ATP-binding protein
VIHPICDYNEVMSTILQIDHLSKSYGAVKAVQDVSLEVNEGELFAFLGPNGAGKSTTINVVCTLLAKDSGEVRINGLMLGKEDDAIRKIIGVVFQKSFLDDLLTVEENLAVRAAFYRLSAAETHSRINELSEQLSLQEFLKRPYGKLSGGQRRRADIARALINRPRLLFLDEPTTGLDPQTRHNIWAYIQRLRTEHKMTIFLTTHYMEEANRCDRVCVIDHGSILEMDIPSNLKVKYAPTLLRVKASTDFEPILKESGYSYTAVSEGYDVVIPDSKAALRLLSPHEALIERFEVLEGTMDTVFLALTGKVIREDAQ